MKELLRTNDPVVISFVEVLLRDSDCNFFIADQNMSVIEGSLGVLPRRVMVTDEDSERARAVLFDAGILDEINPA